MNSLLFFLEPAAPWNIYVSDLDDNSDTFHDQFFTGIVHVFNSKSEITKGCLQKIIFIVEKSFRMYLWKKCMLSFLANNSGLTFSHYSL